MPRLAQADAAQPLLRSHRALAGAVRTGTSPRSRSDRSSAWSWWRWDSRTASLPRHTGAGCAPRRRSIPACRCRSGSVTSRAVGPPVVAARSSTALECPSHVTVTLTRRSPARRLLGDRRSHPRSLSHATSRRCTASAPTSIGVPSTSSSSSSGTARCAGCSSTAWFCAPPRPPCDPTRPSNACTIPTSSTLETSTRSPASSSPATRTRSAAARDPNGASGSAPTTSPVSRSREPPRPCARTSPRGPRSTTTPTAGFATSPGRSAGHRARTSSPVRRRGARGNHTIPRLPDPTTATSGSSGRAGAVSARRSERSGPTSMRPASASRAPGCPGRSALRAVFAGPHASLSGPSPDAAPRPGRTRRRPARGRRRPGEPRRRAGRAP